MRVCLPGPSCCIPGQVWEDTFSKSNCTYPKRKAGSCKKGAGEAWSRRLRHSPFLPAVCGSKVRRGSTPWKPHISVQLYSGLEAVGTTLPEQNTWADLSRLGRRRNKTCFQILHSVCLFAFPVHEFRTSAWERQWLFACSAYRRGVELVPQFWPPLFPIKSNFTLQNLCFTEATRIKKELLQWVCFFKHWEPEIKMLNCFILFRRL